jgi:hypothetical protein
MEKERGKSVWKKKKIELERKKSVPKYLFKSKKEKLSRYKTNIGGGKRNFLPNLLANL